MVFAKHNELNVREYRRGNQMDNPEKQATYGTQEEEKHSIICIGHHYMQTRLKVKTNQTSFLCENGNGHHNTEHRTSGHVIAQHTKKQLKD